VGDLKASITIAYAPLDDTEREAQNDGQDRRVRGAERRIGRAANRRWVTTWCDARWVSTSIGRCRRRSGEKLFDDGRSVIRAWHRSDFGGDPLGVDGELRIGESVVDSVSDCLG